jgi:fucose permease
VIPAGAAAGDPRRLALLALVYAAFISMGLPDGVLGVAWPPMREHFGAELASAGWISLVMTGASAVSGFASGWLLTRLGTGRVVAFSCVLTALALCGFGFAPSLGAIVLLTVPLGLGAGAVDAGLNHFVARHYSARHMNWLHGCWGIGATIGPMVMGAALAGGASWQGGHRVIALVQLALAVLLVSSLSMWRREPAATSDTHAQAPGRIGRTGTSPSWAPWLAASLYLVYTTVEVGTGLWAASILVDGRGMAPADAGIRVAGFFGAIMAGRFAIGLVAVRLGNRVLVRYGILTALVGAGLFALRGMPELVALAGLVLLGLGCAPIYPSLMHEATRRVDAGTARRVIGRQVAFAYLGSALGPAALGLLGGWLGLWTIMPAVCLALLALLWMTAWLDRVT